MTYEVGTVSEGWPVADFDPVRQLRVIAAVTPGARIHERVIDAPFAAVWEVAADLEQMPQWLPDIRSVRYRGTEALVIGHSRLRARFDVENSPGWCLMRSRFLVGGMAARAEEEGTRFAVLGALRIPLAGLLGPLLGPVVARTEPRAARRFEALVRAR